MKYIGTYLSSLLRYKYLYYLDTHSECKLVQKTFWEKYFIHDLYIFIDNGTYCLINLSELNLCLYKPSSFNNFKYRQHLATCFSLLLSRLFIVMDALNLIGVQIRVLLYCIKYWQTFVIFVWTDENIQNILLKC